MNLERGKEYSVQLIICSKNNISEYDVDEIIRDALYDRGIEVIQSFDFEEIKE